MLHNGHFLFKGGKKTPQHAKRCLLTAFLPQPSASKTIDRKSKDEISETMDCNESEMPE